MLEGQSLLSHGDNSPIANNNLNSNATLHSNATLQSLYVNNKNNASKSQLKYQYSFTDAIILDELSSIADFKVKK